MAAAHILFFSVDKCGQKNTGSISGTRVFSAPGVTRTRGTRIRNPELMPINAGFAMLIVDIIINIITYFVEAI